MKAFLRLKLREFNSTYEKMERSRKGVILFGIFIALSMIISDTVMLKSSDKLKVEQQELEKLSGERTSLLKEKESIIIKNAYKTEKSLQKRKEDLKVEIESLLEKDSSKNYLPSNSVGTMIKEVVSKVSQVKMISFGNIPSGSTGEKQNQDIIVRHDFVLNVEGSFQGTYELIANLEELRGISLDLVSMEKNKDGVLATKLNFYVMNTNKNILNF